MNFLKNLALDKKKKHLAVGFAIGFVVSLILQQYISTPTAHLIGVGLGVFAGWAKEHLWDARGRGTVDAKDFQITAAGAGAVLGALAALVAKHLYQLAP